MSTVQGTPSWRQVGQHAVFPQATHDEVARFDFLTRLNMHLSQAVLPGVSKAYESRVKPAFVQDQGRAPQDRHEVRRAMQRDLHYSCGAPCAATPWSSASRPAAA